MRVTESMGPAWETMKRLLFRPFNIGTWFSFGFIFFLQSCVEGGGSNGMNIPGGNGGGSSGSHDGDTGNNLLGIAHDLAQHGLSGSGSPFGGIDRGVLVIIAVVAVVLMIPVVGLMMWLGTRGQMMAIRAVAGGQANISEQWNATREPGGALFKLNLAMTAISLLVFIPLGIIGFVLLMPVLSEGAAIESRLPALLAIGGVAILAVFPLLLVSAMARNFVAPIMLKHGIGAREGWKRFWAVGRNHVGGIFVFFVLRVLVGLGAGIAGLIASFLTCCLGFLPVLHQTLMAPYYVFERAWVLEVLASMSPDFDLRGAAPPGPGPMAYAPGPGYAGPYGGPPPADNPYAPPGYGGGGGNPYGGGGGEPPGGFGAP